MSGKETTDRETWNSKIEFILACVGYAVGLGNLWRFPYLCYTSGGGAFLIPYFVTLVFIGIPLLYMEMALGQYMRSGPMGSIRNCCPLLKGVALGTVVITFILCTYYNVIMSWAIFYLVSSFWNPLPWENCDHDWNTENCISVQDIERLGNESKPNYTTSPSQEYYDNRVLQMTDGIDDIGGMRWELVGALAVAWLIVYICICKGIKSSGKVVYITATFPYLVLTALLIAAVRLPGATDGIKYLFIPEWDRLLDINVWVAAAAQNFGSIGIGFGSLIAYSSYNSFNNNILQDTFTVSIINSMTSIFGSVVIFSGLGYMAHVQKEDVENVATSGPGLVFVAFPAIFPTMPVPQLWSALFFIMLLCLGVDSQFAMVEMVITTLKDEYPKIVKYLYRTEILVFIVCFIFYFCGWPNITEGGIYVFQILDWYTSILSIFVLVFFEVVAIAWVYGANRLSNNVKEMNGTRAPLFFVICWYIISPLMILGIFVASCLDYTVVTYGDYVYPHWAEILGWSVASLSMICIPLGAIHALIKAEGETFWERLVNSCTPNIDFNESEDFEMDNTFSLNFKNKSGSYVVDT